MQALTSVLTVLLVLLLKSNVAKPVDRPCKTSFKGKVENGDIDLRQFYDANYSRENIDTVLKAQINVNDDVLFEAACRNYRIPGQNYTKHAEENLFMELKKHQEKITDELNKIQDLQKSSFIMNINKLPCPYPYCAGDKSKGYVSRTVRLLRSMKIQSLVLSFADMDPKVTFEFKDSKNPCQPKSKAASVVEDIKKAIDIFSTLKKIFDRMAICEFDSDWFSSMGVSSVSAEAKSQRQNQTNCQKQELNKVGIHVETEKHCLKFENPELKEAANSVRKVMRNSVRKVEEFSEEVAPRITSVVREVAPFIRRVGPILMDIAELLL